MLEVHSPFLGRTEHTASSGRSVFHGHLFVLLVGALLLVPGSSPAQTTQTLSLEEGWNLVSLRVQPEDSSFASILDGSVSIVKNEDGAAYLPSQGIEQISKWRIAKGYRLHAKTATTLNITGLEVPAGMMVELNKGGNIVPYLPTNSLDVEEALVSIEESLIAVRDEEGRRYDPSASSSPLDSLHPGQGYKVYVDRADTLRYPRVAKTLDDALALQQTDVGSYVRVLGYHEPKDGGGGLFQVMDNARRTDGGTAFIFDEDLSTEQQTQLGGGNRLGSPTDLPDSDLSWRNFRLRYGSGSDDYFTAINLAGHLGTANAPGVLNTKEGMIGGAGAHLFGQKRNYGGGDSYDWQISYKHATTDRRLVRMNVTDAVNVAWWGADPVSAGWSGWSDLEHRPPDDNTAEFNWATTRAQRLLEEDSSLSTAYVDVPGMYYKLFRTLMPDNVIYRGVGAERTVGNATVKGGIKMPPGIALWYELDGPLGNDWNRWERARIHKWGFTHGHFPMENKVGFQNFDIHGNLANNQNPWENPSDYQANIGNLIQNASAWTGWRTSKKGQETTGTGRGYIEGLRLVLNNTAIRQMGGNGINTADGSIVLDTDGYYAGSAQRNHSIYGFAGPGTDEPAIAENIQFSGFSWAVPIKLGTWKDYNFNFNTIENLDRRGESEQWGTTYKNITVKNLERNQVSGLNWTQIFNVEKANVDFDGYTVDFTGSPHGGRVFSNNFGGNVIENGNINIDDESGLFISPIFDRVYSFLDDEITKVHTLTVEGSAAFVLTDRKNNKATNVDFRDVTINAPALENEKGYALGAGMTPLEGFDPNLPGATRMQYTNADWNAEVDKIARLRWNPGDYTKEEHHARDFFVANSSINNTGDWSIQLDKESHASIAGRHDRIYMSNTTFNVPLSSLEWKDQFHYALSPNPTVSRTTGQGDWIVQDGPQIRLRNCTTPNGRVSDSENNTFTSGSPSEGRDYVLISTSLLGRPFEINTTLTSSPSNISSITSVEVANSDGSLRPDDTQLEHDPYLKVNLDGTIGSGESVTIDWTARVTPLDQYSTTGLFISRPVPDKTFASGNGPFTVDLRGVAASQETWTPPAYSASSSNAGVVTANVTATNHRGTDRFYMLELTEQSAGTAAITVDAEIPGVGTATTTFEVTVE